MMGALFELVIHLIVNLALVKLIFFREGKKTVGDSLSWKSAADAMQLMETRLEQLQSRDIRQQERVWALEDINRDLQQRVARLTKELLTFRKTDEIDPFDPADDDDHDHDDDRHESIPIN